VAAAVDLLCESGATSILGVSRMWTHPSECLRMWPDGRWSYLVSPVKRVTRRQDYPDVPYYFVNGAIYGFFASRFLEDGCFITDDCRLLVMDDLNSVDIDTERDFRVAEALLTWKAQRG
jgi:N-acylneuraminate cytidylyltransferase/CMP-N,N'-diacetyllegionaminic acid synthase